MGTFRQPGEEYKQSQIDAVFDRADIGEVNPITELVNAQIEKILGGNYEQKMEKRIDEIARQSYAQASEQINRQAGMGRDAAMDAMARRGIAHSSETPTALSVLEGKRLQAIGDTASNIERNRMGSQINFASRMPGQLMAMGGYGQAQSQQNIANQLAAIDMGQRYTLGIGQLGLQAGQMTEQSNQQDFANQVGMWSAIGQGVGNIAGLGATGGMGGGKGGPTYGDFQNRQSQINDALGY